MADVLGVDFGTSNTVGVLVAHGRPPRFLAIEGAAWIPSAIYVEDDGTLAVGRDAERMSRQFPERFEANPKRRIDDGDILLGVRVVSVVDAIAAVLRRVVDEARRQLNGKTPDEVHLTHPAKWGAARQNVLLAAARIAGLGPQITLVAEPVAAAAHFASLPGKSLPPEASLAVYDLGGGTFDCAVVTATGQGYTVLAQGGLPDIGGVDLDQVLFDHIGRSAAAEDPVRWQGIAAPRNAADRRGARVLREEVRAAKETLSRHAQTELPLPEPFDDTLVTRTEFEGLIRPGLTRTVELLLDTVRRAGLRPDQLAGIYLVGGSSRIPLIAKLIAELTGVVATTLDQPETSVATGAALAAGHPAEPARTRQVTGPPPTRPADSWSAVQPGGGSVGRGGGSPGGPGPDAAWNAGGWPQNGPAFQPGPGPYEAAQTGYGPYPGQPPNGPTKPWHQQGVYVPPANSSRRRLVVISSVAAVVVVALAVTLIVVLTRNHNPPAAAGCSGTPDSAGRTQCMFQASGNLLTSTGTCSSELTGSAAAQTASTTDTESAALRSASVGLTSCVQGTSAGLVMAQLRQPADISTWATTLRSEVASGATVAGSGTFTIGSTTGTYTQAGSTASSSSGAVGYVLWQTSSTGVLGLYEESGTSAAAFSAWKSATGATTS